MSWEIQMSQNNRALRSNPNAFLGSDGNQYSSHKITEPYAQIPTSVVFLEKNIFPNVLHDLSQNNRALRSNPNENERKIGDLEEIVTK